ncbi:hypothetical protein EYF80_063819 [Liparis tanakae]|uniref:Uncharacterized protein n=1 Tax=Liparis tanakae TaxID=230148 RepID=A0A4Z2EBC1_9TELE|nr:hypothetical protein EYF80_063819 [Liparis tanakae]
MKPGSALLLTSLFPSQATRCGSTRRTSWRRATPGGSPAWSCPPTCSTSTLPSTSGRTGRPTSLPGTNSGGTMKIRRKWTLASPDSSQIPGTASRTASTPPSASTASVRNTTSIFTGLVHLEAHLTWLYRRATC